MTNRTVFRESEAKTTIAVRITTGDQIDPLTVRSLRGVIHNRRDVAIS